MTVRITDEGSTDPNAPLERFLGQNLLLYGLNGNFQSNDDICYARIRLPEGAVVTSMRTYVGALGGGPGSGKNIRMGIYDQSDIEDATLGPDSRVAQTALIPLAGLDMQYHTVALEGGDYTVPKTGWYWLALTSTSASTDFRSTNTAPAGFWPVQEESGSNGDLPTSASASAIETAVMYVAAVEATP
ncbi:MAG: hypothetical protein ACXABY_04660 [Candidatus Thorarchaeota archaeon]|jgi:hypothetical protein